MTIVHRITDKPTQIDSDTTSPQSDIASQLSGMIGQASSLASGGVGLPGLNSLGSAISSLASSVTGAGSSIGSSIASLGASMATGGMAGMSALASSMTSLSSSLTSLLNPGGALAQIIHHHTLDKNNGIKTSAFQGQHTTTWDNNGVTHTSSSKVTSTAPNLPHNGNILGSDNFTLTKVMTAFSYGTTSDARLKTDIADFPPALDRAMTVEVKTFDKRFVATDLTEAGDHVHSAQDGAQPSFGFIAQELRAAFPELVEGDEAAGFLSVLENKVGIVALAALQEFVRETRQEIADLKRRLDEK